MTLEQFKELPIGSILHGDRANWVKTPCSNSHDPCPGDIESLDNGQRLHIFRDDWAAGFSI